MESYDTSHLFSNSPNLLVQLFSPTIFLNTYPFLYSNSIDSEEYSTSPSMEKRLFEYTPDLEENFELKKNETKNYVPCVVVDANTTWNIAYKLETK